MNASTVNCLAGIAAIASVAASAAGGDVPFSAIRLRKPQTDSASVWQATLAQFAKHRANAADVSLPLARSGSDAAAVLPPVPAWTGGYLIF